MTGGFWAERLRTNRERTLPHAFEQLVEAGNLENFRLAAGTATGALPRARDHVRRAVPVPRLGRLQVARGRGLGARAGVGRRHRGDGRPGDRRSSPRRSATTATSTRSSRSWRRGASTATCSSGHELYCIGHLVQAAVAWHRALGDDRLLAVARRAADSVDAALGPGRRRRDRRPSRDRDGAGRAVPGDGRGRATSSSPASTSTVAATAGWGPDGSAARTGRTCEPVREARGVAGHAVRQLYLDAGAIDVAVETGDAALLDAVHARWRDMIATRTYLTGGRRQPPRAGGVRRPVRAAARPRVHRDLRGDRRRHGRLAAPARDRRPGRGRRDRAGGRSTACCRASRATGTGSSTSTRSSAGRTGSPPSRGPASASRGTPAPAVRRTSCGRFASWPQVLATTDGHGHPGPPVRGRRDRRRASAAAGSGWPSRPTIRGAAGSGSRSSRRPTAEWTLSLRIPGWATAGDDRLGDGRRARTSRPATAQVARDPPVAGRRRRRPRARDARPRSPSPRPQVDAIRGCVALERGPLVYAIETADLPAGDRASRTSGSTPAPRPSRSRAPTSGRA